MVEQIKYHAHGIDYFGAVEKVLCVVCLFFEIFIKLLIYCFT